MSLVGILWFDPTCICLEDKILQAANEYQRKTGVWPTHAEAHQDELHEETVMHKIVVTPTRNIQKHHIIVGVHSSLADPQPSLFGLPL